MKRLYLWRGCGGGACNTHRMAPFHPSRTTRRYSTPRAPPRTPQAFADAMATLTAAPERAAAMGAAGLRHVRAVFSRDAFARQLDGIVRRVAVG